MTQRRLWVVEVDTGGINWTPVAYCFTRVDADRQAGHIQHPVRVREYGAPANGEDQGR
jgi:hypothetical protein